MPCHGRRLRSFKLLRCVRIHRLSRDIAILAMPSNLMT